jgi:chemotaxis protein CheY-P-specific phosphatase CheC
MTYDIDQVTILKAAEKMFGQNVQISYPSYIDLSGEYITIMVTAYHARSFKARFYYKKGSFDPKDPDLTL